MAMRRSIGFVSRIQEAAKLKGPAYQKAMDELYTLHQSTFDPEARKAVFLTELSQDRKDLIDSIIDHMLDMSHSEFKVLKNKLRPAGEVNWNVFKRESRLTTPPSEGPLKELGLAGFPAQIMEQILSGELFQGLAQSEVQVEAAPQVEVKVEKTNFNLVLKGFDAATKVKLIKEVKDQLALGLKESKEKVEEALAGPVVLFKGIPKEQAEERLAKLKAVGAVVELE